MEYVLQKYSILSESVYGLTSVTLKSKRRFKNKIGLFTYRSMKEALFTGYVIKQVGGFSIKIATKAKALFDYLYYQLFRIQKFDELLLESFRLNMDEWVEAEWNEFAGYCTLVGNRKMAQLPAMLKKIV